MSARGCKQAEVSLRTPDAWCSVIERRTHGMGRNSHWYSCHVSDWVLTLTWKNLSARPLSRTRLLNSQFVFSFFSRDHRVWPGLRRGTEVFPPSCLSLSRGTRQLQNVGAALLRSAWHSRLAPFIDSMVQTFRAVLPAPDDGGSLLSLTSVYSLGPGEDGRDLPRSAVASWAVKGLDVKGCVFAVSGDLLQNTAVLRATEKGSRGREQPQLRQVFVSSDRVQPALLFTGLAPQLTCGGVREGLPGAFLFPVQLSRSRLCEVI